jgi:hypothetical protein
MFKEGRKKLANLIYPEFKDELWNIDNTVNQRVARFLSTMDPFEPVLKLYHGVFSEEYERPEDILDEKSKFYMRMWAWQTMKDPNFKYFMDWLANTFGNETLKRVPINDDKLASQRLWYGRAQISTVILLKREIGRLSNGYEEELNKNKPDDFDKNVGVEL